MDNTISYQEWKSSILKKPVGKRKKVYTIIGEIISIRVIETKNKLNMAFIDLKDCHTVFKTVLFTRTWEKYRDHLKKGDIAVFSGQVENSDKSLKFIVDKISLPCETSQFDNDSIQGMMLNKGS